MAIDRRGVLIGGGVGLGLVVAWAVWPRAYPVNLTAADGEQIFGGWLKIGSDGHIVVVVPQCEHGQGVFTALPQIVADELGADWRTVGVEAAPVNPAYANPMAAEALFAGAFGGIPEALRTRAATRDALMLTGGSTSIRMFEAPLRRAGAAARALLCQAAAARWGVDWRACTAAEGFVLHGKDKLRFGVLAEEAAGGDLPDDVLPRADDEGRLTGVPVPRLDSPAKVDGSANYAGDIRLPNMVFASIRQGPSLASRLLRVDRAAADRIPGVTSVVENPNWVAAIGTTWWAANRALDALAPRFETPGPLPTSASIDAALTAALAGEGQRIAGEGDVAAALAGGRVLAATYRTAPSLHAGIEPVTATATIDQGKLILWMPTQAPTRARAAAAAVLGMSADAVVLHPMIAGGSFGANLEHRVAQQAALLARELHRPVQLTWSRAESLMRTPVRPPAAARMTARIATDGTIRGWHARIAAPSSGRDLARRLLGNDALLALGGAFSDGDAAAVAGASPFYRLPAWALDHHPAEIGVPTGWWRSGGHASSAFFTECFLDELAHAASVEPLSYRIAMLGGAPRLARCLSVVASLGGWQGGIAGSGQGIACHSLGGSYIALLAEAGGGANGRPRVDRLVAAVDCGRVINPDLVTQAIEGGLIFGLAAAIGATADYADGMVTARRFGALGLPRLDTIPEITVELIQSDAEPGGASELGVAVVAPAVANALFAATGIRHRRTPLIGLPS